MDKNKRRDVDTKVEYLDRKFYKKSKHIKVEVEFYDPLTEWLDYKVLYNKNNQNKQNEPAS